MGRLGWASWLGEHPLLPQFPVSPNGDPAAYIDTALSPYGDMTHDRRSRMRHVRGGSSSSILAVACGVVDYLDGAAWGLARGILSPFRRLSYYAHARTHRRRQLWNTAGMTSVWIAKAPC
jgi:hypothetical protein